MNDQLTRQQGAVAELLRGFAGLRTESSGFAADLAFDLRAATEELRRADRETRSLSRSMGSGLRRAFDQAVFGGDRLSGVLKGLAADISRSALNSALRPVQNAVAGGLNQLIGGGVQALLGFGNGAAFSSGRVTAFAKGGVIGGPTLFPMRGGLGLMGEAGAEAIMPLTRGPDGKLGVRTEGGGSPVNVTVNISANDVDSFKRSQSQVAATIARAVRRGQRNM